MQLNYKEQISYPKSIDILAILPEVLLVKGPKGIAKIRKSPFLNILSEKFCSLTLTTKMTTKTLAIAFKAEFQKILLSVTHGFFNKISLEGLAYKLEKENDELIFWLGFSHKKRYKLPQTVKVELESPRSFYIYGVDPKEVSLVCDQILNLKKKEIYKKRGFIYHENPKKNWYSENEQIKVLNKKK